jgi:hypothetical protein
MQLYRVLYLIGAVGLLSCTANPAQIPQIEKGGRVNGEEIAESFEGATLYGTRVNDSRFKYVEY